MTSLKGYPIPVPKTLAYPVSMALQGQTFENIQTYYPGMGIIAELRTPPKGDLWFDHSHRVIGYNGKLTNTSAPLNLRIEKNIDQSGVDVQDISGFCKMTHLLDPIHWIQGKYSLPKHTSLPWHQESWGAAWKKLQDPMNQAYVEALCAYAFGKLAEGGFTPHFHRFYGSFCAVTKSYSYNITESYMSYRHARWFWNGQEKEVFRLHFDEDIPDEVKEAVSKKPDDIYDSEDEATKRKESDASEEELGDLGLDKTDVGSIRSAGIDSLPSLRSESTGSGDTDDDDDDDDEEEDLNIFAEVKHFPVMVIFTESSEGTMDGLLDNYKELGCTPGTHQWDLIWSAWIFQVIAALCVGQAVLGFTHNDLHSNNIVWAKTEQEYLYYKTHDGIQFRVPTFGKMFRLIDFGRSIFRINEHMFFSDDFRPGNDAAEQYNFGEIRDSKEPEVLPNPSFDLARFTVSIFESIFPSSPSVRKGGAVLSDEPGLKIVETESDLYNLLWSWLLCENGHNILMEADGKERYPDFDLYKVIAAQVKNAVPCEQVRKPVFEQFRITELPEGTKVYSLFC